MRLVASLVRALLFVALFFGAKTALAEPLHVAVTANFAGPFRHLAERFEAESGHRVIPSFAATGKLYAQIRHGAPFHLFLAADGERPRLLEEQGLAVPGSRFVYARGRLVLWSPTPGLLAGGAEALRGPGLSRIALANPRLAPYGHAARRVLEKLGLWAGYQGRMAFGENVGQALTFVVSGNAQAGFVALSQVLDGSGAPLPGSLWEPPVDLSAPLDQEAVLLKRGEGVPAAQAFNGFLRSAAVQADIGRLGYASP